MRPNRQLVGLSRFAPGEGFAHNLTHTALWLEPLGLGVSLTQELQSLKLPCRPVNASASWTVGWRLEGIPKESQSCEPDRVDSCWHIHFKPASQLDRVSD